MSHQCTACPAGHAHAGGDVQHGPDTSCDEVLCHTNERVLGHQCVACPPGSTNAAGDGAASGDTQCDHTICPAPPSRPRRTHRAQTRRSLRRHRSRRHRTAPRLARAIGRLARAGPRADARDASMTTLATSAPVVGRSRDVRSRRACRGRSRASSDVAPARARRHGRVAVSPPRRRSTVKGRRETRS